jgi:hypothetical protein
MSTQHHPHPASAPHATPVGAARRRLQHRLGALRAGLRAALRAFKTPQVKPAPRD